MQIQMLAEMTKSMRMSQWHNLWQLKYPYIHRCLGHSIGANGSGICVQVHLNKYEIVTLHDWWHKSFTIFDNNNMRNLIFLACILCAVTGWFSDRKYQWNLHSRWLKVLRQSHIALVIRIPAPCQNAPPFDLPRPCICCPIYVILALVIVRRAGLLWSQQDFEWRWSVPLFKCLTVLEFSFILFDLCLLITFFNFIMNYVPVVTFWIFTYHKIRILSIMFCSIWSYWIIYFLACLEVSWRVVS